MPVCPMMHEDKMTPYFHDHQPPEPQWVPAFISLRDSNPLIFAPQFCYRFLC